jgi:hypothetical protein
MQEFVVGSGAEQANLLALADAGHATGERVWREARFELDTRPFAGAETWMRPTSASWEQRPQGLKAFLERDA